MRFRLQNKRDTMEWGSAFGALLQPGDVVALVGDLGSGKTTLSQAIGAGLGVTDPVTSPTFSLIQEYAGPVPLYHFDPYRLNHPEEISELGLDEYLQREGVVIIEWADLIERLLPPDRFEICIEIPSPSDQADDSVSSPRSLSIEGIGVRPMSVVSQLCAIPGAANLTSEVEAKHAG